MELTQERLKELLHYDPEIGVFTWIGHRGSSIPGGIAGKAHNGYLRFRIDKKTYAAHRLAWLYVTGANPRNQVDHINGIRNDNRFSNLRQATAAENKQNIRLALSTNTSGLLGAHFHKRRKKWTSSVMRDSVRVRLGYFSTPEEAHAAYLAAKRELHQFCTI